MSESINWYARRIQEIPESECIMYYQITRSSIDPSNVRRGAHRASDDPLAWVTENETLDKFMHDFFSDETMFPEKGALSARGSASLRPQIVTSWINRMFDGCGAIRMQVMFAKLDRSKYVELDEAGTKMTHAILGLVASDQYGRVHAAPPEQLNQMAAQLGFLPPTLLPMPYCTARLFDEGLRLEAIQSLEWLKNKPGNLLRQDVRARYCFSDPVPGDIFATLGTEPIKFDYEGADAEPAA
jgi:hypothetical protein